MLVYLIENKCNGKRYVGQTTRSLDWRWRNHVGASERGAPQVINRAIRKYGPDAFVCSVLGTATSQNELDALETKFILELQTLSPAGYNLTTGGEHPTVTDEVRAKHSVKSKGHHRWTPEAIAKSVATRRRNGKYAVSEETRDRMSAAARRQTNRNLVGLNQFYQDHPEAHQEHSRRGGEVSSQMRAQGLLPTSQETRDKISKAQEKIWTPAKRAEQAVISANAMTPERRAKQMGNNYGTKNLGSKRTFVARAKMSASAKARYERQFLKTVAWG